MRSLLSFLLIGVPVTLILTLVGLSHGMLEDAKQRARGVGADIMVRAPARQPASQLERCLDAREVRRLSCASMPHVKLAMGVINHSDRRFPLVITGLDLDKFNAMSGGFTYLAGQRFAGPDDILVDKYYAKQKKLQVGDTITAAQSRMARGAASSTAVNWRAWWSL